MVTLTIDGKKVTSGEGSTILTAAQENGIDIPTLCHHQGLSPLGNCRLCVVEVTRNGRTKVVTSCNYLVEEGLTVETTTDQITSLRKSIIQLLVARSPNVKIVRELAEKTGVVGSQLNVENEKCILCGLCVHVCSEYIGAHAITFSGHGTLKSVSSPLFRNAADCIGCGACVEICPAQCITMDDIEDAKTYYPGGKEVVGPVRLIHNWNARVPWKHCKSCTNPFPPPSPRKLLEKGQPLPKDFFETCEQCKH